MGCYNSTGFVSGLNIRYNDPIVAIPCIINHQGKYNLNNYYTTSQLRPISLPLFGKYDDYNSIEDVEDTPSAKAWKMSVCNDIVACMKIFERSMTYNTKLSETLENKCKFKDDVYNEVKSGLLRMLSPTDKICLILEHRAVYDKLIQANDKFRKEFFVDIVSFNKLLLDEGCTVYPASCFGSPFEYRELDHMISKQGDKITDRQNKIINKSDKLKKKWRDLISNCPFLNWYCGFDVYNYGCSAEDSILNIEGIVDAFSDFSTFNDNIMHLNVGYRVPSCNCGSQEDYNKNVVKFYDFLSDFYEKELKPEPDEDDWLDEDEE